MSANVRVEARPMRSDASFFEKDKAFRSMMSVFKRRVNDAGILIEYGRRQSFESRGQKIRRKEKESFMRRQKAEYELHSKVRDRFGSNSKKPPKRKGFDGDMFEPEYTEE